MKGSKDVQLAEDEMPGRRKQHVLLDAQSGTSSPSSDTRGDAASWRAAVGSCEAWLWDLRFPTSGLAKPTKDEQFFCSPGT